MQPYCMSCITTENKTKWTADLARTILMIAAIDAAFLDAADKATVSSYSFDSGTGRQQESFRSPLELIDALRRLEAKRDKLQRFLNGTAVTRMQLRR